MPAHKIVLSLEQAGDFHEVEDLYDAAFGHGRTGLSSYRLRGGLGPVGALCLVARDERDLICGAIRYWPVRVEAHAALLLGPLAVHPTRQGENIGALLIYNSRDRAIKRGDERILLIGDAPYYQRFGFIKLHGIKMPPPTNPDRVLGLSLRPGAWDDVRGVVSSAAQPPGC